MKRLVAVVAVLALLLVTVGTVGLVVARFVDSGSPSATPAPSPLTPTTPTEAPAEATEPPYPALAPFYSQELVWSECEGSRECAELEVPLDYADPAGETISLALLRVRAEGDRVGSLVVNPGGPGAPGTEYAKASDLVFRQPVLDAFDVVGFDPRGTGDSAPIDCLTDDELDAYLASDPDPDDAAEVAEFERQVEEFGAGCARRSGDLVDHVSTIEAARDMDVLRAALGEPELLYFGASYGTKLGATYAELFPDRVGRLVLDGAVDVSLDSRELSLDQARGFETALRAYVDNCLTSTDNCFLGDSVEAGLDRITDLLARVEAEPLPAGDRELRIGNAFYGIVAPLYNRDYWFLLSTALRSALGGDGSMLLELSDLYASRGPDGFTDNSMEAIYAINCLDDPSSIPLSEVPSQFAAFEEASPTFGQIFAWGLAGCSASRGRSTEPPLDIRAEGAAPILVIGTTRDPATPMKWAEALAAQLESGVLIERDGDGHTGYNAGNPCVDEAVEAYLVSGTVPDDPTTC